VQKVEGNVTRFERLGLENGLSQGCVYAILQDSQGFLWIGTQDGLNKYDAYTFTVYRHDLTNPISLSTNHIYTILEDSEGDLWLGTDRGPVGWLVQFLHVILTTMLWMTLAAASPRSAQLLRWR
jgi:hypothetical protein